MLATEAAAEHTRTRLKSSRVEDVHSGRAVSSHDLDLGLYTRRARPRPWRVRSAASLIPPNYDLRHFRDGCLVAKP
jgi:hypothetical protein